MALGLGACGGHGPGVSEGTVVHWTRAEATRPELSSAGLLSEVSEHRRRAILGAHTAEPAELRVTFEAASLDVGALRGQSAPMVPTDVRIDVMDNERWSIDATCTGPHWPRRNRTRAVGTTMVVDCRTSLHDSDGATVIAVLQLYGDGTVVETGDVELADD